MGKKKTRGEMALGPPFKLGNLTVEPQSGTISGPAGPVQVDLKVMAVLALLAKNAGKVVSREMLLAEVWSGTIVSDDAVSRCIYQLRQHLRQAGGSKSYRELLETFPKRGYRLNSRPVDAVAGPRDETGGLRQRSRVDPRRWASSKLAVSATLALTAVFVAVAYWSAPRPVPHELASTNASAYDAYVRANDYFARTDRHAALPYAAALYEEAADLDPNFSLALAGLARAHTELYWHGVDRTPARLAQAENAISRLFSLDANLPEARFARVNYLLKGLNRYQEALDELAEAEKSMPHEPELYFLRAMANRRLGNWDLAIDSLNQALELDSRNSAYLRQQYISYQFTRDYKHADELLDRLLQLYPDDGTVYVDKVALSLCRDGDTGLFHRYEEFPPNKYYDDGLAYTYTSWLAAAFDRDYEKALRILRESAEDPIFDGDFRNASFGPKSLFYARTHRLAGDDETAREEYLEVVRIAEEHAVAGIAEDSRTAASRYLALAEAKAALGQREQAMELIERAGVLLPKEVDALEGSALQLASVIRVLVPAGYDEEALQTLDSYLGKQGHWSIEGLRRDPRLESLRNHPGFRDLEQKYARL